MTVTDDSYCLLVNNKTYLVKITSVRPMTVTDEKIKVQPAINEQRFFFYNSFE